MIPSIEAVRKVLDKLVTPKYPKIIDYEVQMDMDENSSLITSVEVFFEPKGYSNTYHNGDYDYTGEFEADIEDTVLNALKYLGLNKRVYTAVYISDDITKYGSWVDDDSDAGN
jgi:hypothetical protein